jgi:hypothetical protein
MWRKVGLIVSAVSNVLDQAKGLREVQMKNDDNHLEEFGY